MQNQDHLNQENSELVNRDPESKPMAERQESPGNPENKEVDSPDSPRGSSVVPTPMKPRKKPGLKLVLAILIPALVLMIAASGLLIFFHAPMNPEKAYQKTTAAFLADYQEYVSQMDSLMKDPATGKTDTKVNTVLNLSAKSTGLASDLKVDASVTRSGEDFLLNVRVYTDLKEAFLTCGKAEDTLGFSLSVPLVEKDWLKKSMAGYVQIKGLAESFRNSPFNPANNPDSGLTQEQFDALLQLCQTLERELDTAIPDAQEEQEPMLLPNLLVDFYQAFMKKASIKSYSTFPSGSSFGLFHPERHIEVSLDEEAFSSVPGIIRDLLKEPKYEFVLDELNAILKEVQVDELNADDVNSFLDEMQKDLDEAHLTFTGSIVSLDGKITSAKLSTEFSTSSDPDHPENARVDLSIRVEYGNGRKDASVKNAGLSIELYEDDQLEARTGLDYTCEKTAEGTLAGELKFSLAEWSDDDPPVKKDLYHAEMQFGDEKFSLSLGDNFEVKGSYAFSNLDDGTPSFQLKLNELTKTQLIPKYIIGSGIQYVKEETCFSDFLTVTVQRASGVMLPKKALNRNLLDSEDDPVTYLRQNAGDCWKAAREYVAFALTPNPSEVPVLTEDGYQIQDVQQIGEEYMNILQKYNQTVNEYVQWYAIPEDPVFTTCLFQSDVSGLWYYLYVDWTKSECSGLLYADPPEELIQMIHPAKIVSGKMVIHEWQMQDEVIHSCSEPDYKLGTCSFCDCQLKRYVSEEPSLQHVFSPDAIGYEFDPDTGTEETAVYRTCTQCGRCEVEFKSYIFEMVVSDNQATVVSGQEMNPGTDPLDYPHCMVIPQFADKDHRIPVTTIEGPVHLNSSILFIPDGVKVLKEGAFDSYTSYVRAVFLPKSIERIERSSALRDRDITLFFEGNEEEWFSIGPREAQFGWPGFPFEDLYENEGVFLARNQALYDAYNILNTASSSAMQLQVGSSIQVYGKNKIITAAEYDSVTDRIALLVEHEIVILNPQDGSVIQTIQTQAHPSAPIPATWPSENPITRTGSRFTIWRLWMFSKRSGCPRDLVSCQFLIWPWMGTN